MGFVVSPFPKCEGPGAPALSQASDRTELESKGEGLPAIGCRLPPAGHRPLPFEEVHLSKSQETRITWLGHATVLIQTPKGTNILIDPFIAHNPKYPKNFELPSKIDYVLLHARPWRSHLRRRAGGEEAWIDRDGDLRAGGLHQRPGSERDHWNEPRRHCEP